MHRIDDHKSELLWDPWHFFGKRRRRMLEGSWAGVVRRVLFEELPIEVFASHFDAEMGRPTKELYMMVGTLVLQQMLDLSDVEVTQALAFDERWHYALDITGDGDADKTVWLCRRMNACSMSTMRRLATCGLLMSNRTARSSTTGS